MLASSRHAGLQPFDLAGNEGAVHERAQPRMDGRLDLEQRKLHHGTIGFEMRLGRGPAKFLARRDMQDLASEAAVPQQGRDIGVGRRAPVPILLPEEQRRRFVQCGVERIWIGEKRGSARIAIHPKSLAVYSHSGSRVPFPQVSAFRSRWQGREAEQHGSAALRMG